MNQTTILRKIRAFMGGGESLLLNKKPRVKKSTLRRHY